MSTPTHFLSTLVVVCSAMPTQLLRIPTGAPGPARPTAVAGPHRPAPTTVRARALAAALVAPALLGAVAGLAWFVAPGTGVVRAPAGWWWCAAAVVFGGALPLVEFGTAALPALLRGRRVTGLRLHERATGPLAAAVPAVVLIAVAEEVIFRGVALHLLVAELDWAAPAAVGLTAVAYGLNHLWFGWPTVAQKVVTGSLLGALYLLAGRSVLVPVLAHVAQNLLVLLLVPRRGTGPVPARPVPTSGASR